MVLGQFSRSNSRELRIVKVWFNNKCQLVADSSSEDTSGPSNAAVVCIVTLICQRSLFFFICDLVWFEYPQDYTDNSKSMTENFVAYQLFIHYIVVCIVTFMSKKSLFLYLRFGMV